MTISVSIGACCAYQYELKIKTPRNRRCQLEFRLVSDNSCATKHTLKHPGFRATARIFRPIGGNEGWDGITMSNEVFRKAPAPAAAMDKDLFRRSWIK